MTATLQDIRIGWRRSKAGKKYHLYRIETAPLCGKHMKNVYLAETGVNLDLYCKRCLKSQKRDDMNNPVADRDEDLKKLVSQMRYAGLDEEADDLYRKRFIRSGVDV